MKKQKRSKFNRILLVIIIIATILAGMLLPKKGSSQILDRRNVDVIHEQLGVNQVIKKDTTIGSINFVDIPENYISGFEITGITYDGILFQDIKTGEITFDSSFVKQFMEQSVLKYLLKYRQECYNDSTKATYDFYKYGNDTVMRMPSCDPGFHQGYIGRKSIYEHKQPTFADFIDWLERRNK